MLGQAIDSVLAQTYTDYELIVVDDGSQDRTREIIASYGDRILPLHQEHRGQSEARNLALRFARGEYVAFIDSDDIWKPCRLERQVPVLDADREVGLVFANGDLVTKGKEVVWTFFTYYGRPASGRVFPALLRRNFIPTSSVLTRARCFEQFGPFPEVPYTEDYAKWLQIASAYRVKYIEEPLFVYRVHESNISRDRVREYRLLSSMFATLTEDIKDSTLLPLLASKQSQTEFKGGAIQVLSGDLTGFWRMLGAMRRGHIGVGVIQSNLAICSMLIDEGLKPVRRWLRKLISLFGSSEGPSAR